MPFPYPKIIHNRGHGNAVSLPLKFEICQLIDNWENVIPCAERLFYISGSKNSWVRKPDLRRIWYTSIRFTCIGRVLP